MNAKAESGESKLDSLKWVVVITLLVIGVVGNSYYSDQSLLYRVLGLVGLAVVAALLALQTGKGKAVFELFKEAKAEIRKVVWPTRQETLQTTGIVIVVVLLVGLMLWMIDSTLSWIVSVVIG
jgi:preprotein translocase subunit SecE